VIPCAGLSNDVYVEVSEKETVLEKVLLLVILQSGILFY
jgi:hypothetical protein